MSSFRTSALSAALALAALLSQAPAQAQAVQRPDLVMQFSGPAELQLGKGAFWSATVRNIGSAAAGQSRVTMVLPPGVLPDTMMGSNGRPMYNLVPGCSFNTSTRVLACTWSSIAVGAERTVHLPLRVPATAAVHQITASASVLSGTAEVHTQNNQATVQTLVSSFLPAIGFPVTAMLSQCMGRNDLLECGTTFGQPVEAEPLPLDGNGQLSWPDGSIVATVTGPGQLQLRLYSAGMLASTWTLSPYNSRCYQGPAVYHGLQATYEARVCY